MIRRKFLAFLLCIPAVKLAIGAFAGKPKPKIPNRRITLTSCDEFGKADTMQGANAFPSGETIEVPAKPTSDDPMQVDWHR